MTNIDALKARNAARWHSMHVKASLLPQFKATVDRLIAPVAQARYQGVTSRLIDQSKTDPSVHIVPWWFIAIVSEREYGGPPNWDKQLGQGDPLNEVSHNDPTGMGPYLPHEWDVTPGNDPWTRCCLEVLTSKPPFPAKWSDWSIGGILTLWEEYNGLGYAARGIASPYVWSGSDQYLAGKFIRDHVFDPKKVDVQEGCAPLLAVMASQYPALKNIPGFI